MPIERKDGTTGAELLLKLDAEAGPIPADSTVRIRPRSALGLKYVELERGKSKDTFSEGATDHRRPGRARARAAGVLQPLRRADARQRHQEHQRVRRRLRRPRRWRSTAPSSRCRASCNLVPPVMMVLSDPRDAPGAVLRGARGRRPHQRAARGDDRRRLPRRRGDLRRAGARPRRAAGDDRRDARRRSRSAPPRCATRGRSCARWPASRGDLRLAAGELRRSAPPLRAALQSGIEPAAPDARAQPPPRRDLQVPHRAGAVARQRHRRRRADGDDEHADAADALPRPVRHGLQLLELQLDLPGRPHHRPGRRRGQIQRIRGEDGQRRPGRAEPVRRGVPDQGPARAALRRAPSTPTATRTASRASAATCSTSPTGSTRACRSSASRSPPATRARPSPAAPRVPEGETFTSVAEGLPGIDPGNLRP